MEKKIKFLAITIINVEQTIRFSMVKNKLINKAKINFKLLTKPQLS